LDGESAVLLLSCPDQRGIVAAVADFIARHDGNILHVEQHVDSVEGVFFQRVEFDMSGFSLGREEIRPALAPLVEQFGFDVRLHFSDERERVALLASRQPHCLYDLLARWGTGDIRADLAIVASNHGDHREICEQMGVPFVHLPVTAETKAEQETALLAELGRRQVELVVLARYMQILTSAVVDAYPNRIINIHHSFLPAFVGANPYRQAHDRGVKLIGATAHYVTAALDEGPIIEQDVVRATHRDDIERLAQRSRDLETVVLARAVRAHLERRVLVYGRKTVVFS
jgi:formyltetrahydrofolate deformylase